MSGPRPEWRHKELVLPIGNGRYRFRTLSLYDVWTLWPVLASAFEALKVHRPITFSGLVAEALEHLCPDLKKAPDLEKLTTTHLDALGEFYMGQDWARIKALGDRSGDAETRADPEAAATARQNFYAVCLAGAQAANMSVMDFVEQRFEFCADAIMAMRDALERRNAAEGKLSNGEFLAVMAGTVPVVKYEEGEEKPGWMKAIEEQSKRVQ